MEQRILLNKYVSKNSVNVDNSLSFELSTKHALLPANGVSSVINQHEIYVDERNNCKNYKLFFTINPYMSNVLFNIFTEVVGNEGSSTSFMLTDTPLTKKGDWSKYSVRSYNKGVNVNAINTDISIDTGLTRYEAIRDTEYSHPNIGNFTYYCGVDIFNNHYLRSNGCFAIKKQYSNSFLNNEKVFNTIADILTYGNDIPAKHYRDIPGDGGEESTAITSARYTHMFNHENLLSFKTAFVNNLQEDNGWIGFTNKSYVNVPNHSILVKGKMKDITINKCLNNKGACEFIDLYPDRTLFSFIPKINEKYQNRVEHNWDWCITYPYGKIYEHPNGSSFNFFHKTKGLRVVGFVQDKFAKVNLGDNYVTRERTVVYFRTLAKHGLKSGDFVKMTYGANKDFSLQVVNIGYEDGKYTDYYFQVLYDDLADEWGESSVFINAEFINCINIGVKLNDLYISRMEKGIPSEYYIRSFKCIGGLNSSMNKAGFAKTIYNDPVAQIIYSDNLNVDGLKNHLGMEVDEVFLTFVKRNKGYKEWYLSGKTSPIYVEGSHCFGEVTSGFNFEQYKDEPIVIDPSMNLFNVRKITHSALETFQTTNDIALERDIRIMYDGQEFYGDLVEFNKSTLKENVLEVVHHRFNTAQRELGRLDFTTLYADDLTFDDNDFNIGDDYSHYGAKLDAIPKFTVTRTAVMGGNDSPPAYLCPEGYFYKPHYSVKLHEYEIKVNSSTDSELVITSDVTKLNGAFEYGFTTNIPYNLKNNDVLIIYFNENEYFEGIVSYKTSGCNVVFISQKPIAKTNATDITKVFLRSKDAPETSFYIPDGGGKRLWRNIIPESEISQTSKLYNRPFTNGAIYVNSNINFYLRRQDPEGIYGLQGAGSRGGNSDLQGGVTMDFVVSGLKQILPDVEYKVPNNSTVCEE